MVDPWLEEAKIVVTKEACSQELIPQYNSSGEVAVKVEPPSSPMEYERNKYDTVYMALNVFLLRNT